MICLWNNFHQLAAKNNFQVPDEPLYFLKAPNAYYPHGQPINRPRSYDGKIIYEGELGIVIGRRCRHVPTGRAREVVAGWLVVNDVSVRDWQARSPTFTMGKSWDTHGPIGPWVVSDDEVHDPHDLCIRTTVNGDLRQDGCTADMVFDCWEMIEHLSTAFTLEPGDIISTGTPAGVGMARRPPAWLRAGDTVRIEIDGLGALENPVVDEPDRPPVGLA